MTPATLADFTDVLFAWVRDNDPGAEMSEIGYMVHITATWDGVPITIEVWRRAA